MVGVLGAGLIAASRGADNAVPADEPPEQTGAAEQPAAPTTRTGVDTYTGHTDDVRDLVVLPDGRVVSTSLREVRVWDPDQPGRTQVTFDEDIFELFDIALLPDGRMASAAGARVNIWNVDDPDRRIDDYENTVLVMDAVHVVVLADGRVASNADSRINVWNPADPTVTEAVYTGHDDPIRAMAALPNGWAPHTGFEVGGDDRAS